MNTLRSPQASKQQKSHDQVQATRVEVKAKPADHAPAGVLPLDIPYFGPPDVPYFARKGGWKSSDPEGYWLGPDWDLHSGNSTGLYSYCAILGVAKEIEDARYYGTERAPDATVDDIRKKYPHLECMPAEELLKYVKPSPVRTSDEEIARQIVGEWYEREPKLKQWPPTEPTSAHKAVANMESTPTLDEMEFTHSNDYRSIRWKGVAYSLTPQQAQVVEILHEAYKQGMPSVAIETILDRLGTSTSRLRDTFRHSSLWNTLIIAGKRRDMRRLNLPDQRKP